MNHYKKVIAAGALSVGIGAGAFLFTPAGMNASGNVVLASVDWVNTKINPINSKVSTLETKLASMESKITALETKNTTQQQEIDSLKAEIGNTDTPTPPPPPTTGTHPSTVYATKSSVTIHRGADRSYATVATSPVGTSLQVVDSFKASTGTWYRVQLSTTLLGWVYSGDVSETKTDNTSPGKTVITTGDAHIRRGATSEYAIATTVPKGTTLQHIQTFKNNKGETWYNVETASGIRGWLFGGLGQVQ